VPEVTCGDWVGVSPSEPRVIAQVAPRWSLLQRGSADGSARRGRAAARREGRAFERFKEQQDRLRGH
jgi:hypothetical protein